LSAIKLLGAAALPHRPPLPMAASDTAPPVTRCAAGGRRPGSLM